MVSDGDAGLGEGKNYYYAVKSPKQSLGIFEDIREALAVVYKNGGSCRRFVRKTAAKEYLDMLELKVSLCNGKRFIDFGVDVIDELKECQQDNHEVRVLRQEDVLVLKEEAAANNMALDDYFIEEYVNSELINATGDFVLLYQIHDKALKSLLLKI